jgi:hypothetical protein
MSGTANRLPGYADHSFRLGYEGSSLTFDLIFQIYASCRGSIVKSLCGIFIFGQYSGDANQYPIPLALDIATTGTHAK